MKLWGGRSALWSLLLPQDPGLSTGNYIYAKFCWWAHTREMRDLQGSNNLPQVSPTALACWLFPLWPSWSGCTISSYTSESGRKTSWADLIEIGKDSWYEVEECCVRMDRTTWSTDAGTTLTKIFQCGCDRDGLVCLVLFGINISWLIPSLTCILVLILVHVGTEQILDFISHQMMYLQDRYLNI